MKFSTSDIPQADNLYKVIQTVEAVNEGASTETEIAESIEFTERQARYYRHAAEILGFITNNRNHAVITDNGKDLANTNEIEKIILFKKAIYGNIFLNQIVQFFEKNNSGMTEEEIKTFISSITDNSAQSTIPRRIKTILSWFEEVEIIIEEEDKFKYNDKIDVEIEDKPESIYPSDNYSKEIDIKEERFSVYELIRKISQNKILMNPDFQRNKVWKQFQKSQFVESIILNIPLPPFYFRQELDGSYVIVDGLQRTSTLNEFLSQSNDDYFALIGLEALPKLNDKYYHELDEELRTRIEDKVLLVYVLRPSVPMVVVYDIFNRINTGGTKLERQEIRNCIFIGNSTTLLKRLAESEEFKTAIDYGISPIRMKDREAVLRCLAFKIFNYETDYSNSMDDFLERTMRKINKMTKQGIIELENDFKRVMKLTSDFFGASNFRLPTDYSRGRINIAIMESISLFFSNKNDGFLVKNKQKIIDNYFNRLLKSPDYLEAVRFSTGTTSKVKDRFYLAEEILSAI